MTALGETVKRGFKVSFTDVHGIPEAGIDGGGLFKDFMENLVKECFDPQLGLFLSTEDNRLYPNPNARVAMDSALEALEFLGKIMGLIIYEVSSCGFSDSLLMALSCGLDHKHISSHCNSSSLISEELLLSLTLHDLFCHKRFERIECRIKMMA